MDESKLMYKEHSQKMRHVRRKNNNEELAKKISDKRVKRYLEWSKPKKERVEVTREDLRIDKDTIRNRERWRRMIRVAHPTCVR